MRIAMKRSLVLHLIFFLVFSSGCTISKNRTRTKSEPKIFIKESAFYAGKVEQGDTISHTFMVANQGDEKLLIKKVQPG
jgi:hypothetical protein